MRNVGPRDPGDKLLLTCDDYEKAAWEEQVYAKTLEMQGLGGLYGVYVEPVIIETIKGKGRNPGVKELVYGLFVGRV